jgi:hypothetical protein
MNTIVYHYDAQGDVVPTTIVTNPNVAGQVLAVQSDGSIGLSTPGGGGYVLPTSSVTVLGGVKIDGSTITINGSGVISATGGGYTLPTASTTVLGGVKVDGSTVTINGSGVISASGGGGYTLPAATVSVLGGVIVPASGRLAVDGSGNITIPLATAGVFGAVKVDGSTITASAGVISAVGGGGYTLPTSSTTVLGGVKIDGSTITINGSGVISAAGGGYTLPTSSTTVLGGVKIDGSTITINGSGVISSTGGYTLPTATPTVLGGVKIDNSTITISSGVISVPLATLLASPPNIGTGTPGGITSDNLVSTGTVTGLSFYSVNTNGFAFQGRNGSNGSSATTVVRLQNDAYAEFSLYLTSSGWATSTFTGGLSGAVGVLNCSAPAVVVNANSTWAGTFTSTGLNVPGLQVATGQTLLGIFSASASLSFGAVTTLSSATQTITVTGATTTNAPSVALGWSAALPSGLVVSQAWVSAANTVSVTVFNATLSTITPSATTCRATVTQF